MWNLAGGQFLDSSNNPIANGTLILQLSTSATIIATGGPAPASYSFALDANGVIIGEASVWGNGELSPAGTYYVATVKDSGGSVVWGPTNWAVGPATLYSGQLYPNVTVLPPYTLSGPIIFEPVSVTYSTTPVFNAALGNAFKITLTGNVVSSTLIGAVAGQILIFEIIEDGTGAHTFAWPSNVQGGMAINTAASRTNVQCFYFDGTNAIALAPGTFF